MGGGGCVRCLLQFPYLTLLGTLITVTGSGLVLGEISPLVDSILHALNQTKVDTSDVRHFLDPVAGWYTAYFAVQTALCVVILVLGVLMAADCRPASSSRGAVTSPAAAVALCVALCVLYVVGLAMLLVALATFGLTAIAGASALCVDKACDVMDNFNKCFDMATWVDNLFGNDLDMITWINSTQEAEINQVCLKDLSEFEIADMCSAYEDVRNYTVRSVVGSALTVFGLNFIVGATSTHISRVVRP